MSAPLYELAAEYRSLLEVAEVDLDGVEDALAKLTDSIEAKGEGICRVLASLEGEVQLLKAEALRLYTRQKTVAANAERLRAYLRDNMQAMGIRKIKGSTFCITLSNAGDKVIVDDESNLPPEFVREKTTREPDKAAILAAYREHGEIPSSCRIEQATSLRIR